MLSASHSHRSSAVEATIFIIPMNTYFHGLNVEVTARNALVAYYQPSDSRLRGKDGQEREKLQQGLASKTGIRI